MIGADMISSLNGVLVSVALLSAGVIYGTDMFFAVVGRSALARVGDAGLTEVMGRLHEVGDARMPVFGAAALLTSLALVFTAGLGSAASFCSLGAVIGLGLQVSAYVAVAQPVNRAQTAAARQGVTPAAARELQRRWDSVISLRALGAAIGVVGLSLCGLTLR
jgi:Domain of unknown function (DUF1772)